MSLVVVGCNRWVSFSEWLRALSLTSVEMKWKCNELVSLSFQEMIKVNKSHRLSQRGPGRRHLIAKASLTCNMAKAVF